MRGIILIILIIALCFSGAGSAMWKSINQLEGSCYVALERVGGSISSKICDAVGRGVAAVDSSLNGLNDKYHAWKQATFGDMSGFDSMTSSIGERLTRLASSNETLTQMMQAGPGSSTRQSIQQAIDSFTIGQGYLKQGGDTSSSEALQWFQHGAQQPQGYGVMSQLQLGNLYMTGQGVPQNNDTAAAYLQQASNSITTLMASNTPQSQQLLSTLPGSPQQIKSQLETAIRQLKMKK